MYNLPITKRVKTGSSIKPICNKCGKKACTCGKDCGCGK